MEEYSGKRYEILKEAIETVCNDRQDQYGNPEDNFSTIAYFWNTYLMATYWDIKNEESTFVNITEDDVAAMMILMKIARIATGNPKKDNWVDICGYSACGAELQHV